MQLGLRLLTGAFICGAECGNREDQAYQAEHCGSDYYHRRKIEAVIIIVLLQKGLAGERDRAQHEAGQLELSIALSCKHQVE